MRSKTTEGSVVMRGKIFLVLAAVPLVLAGPTVTSAAAADKPPCVAPVAATPVATWSTEGALCDRAGGRRRRELRQQVPGRGGRVHGHRPCRDLRRRGRDRGRLPCLRLGRVEGAGERSPEAAIATAAHHTLVGLYGPSGLNPAQQPILDGDYAAYMGAIPAGEAKTNGIAVGEQVAAAVLALRANDGRDENPTPGDLGPPAAGPGVWDPGSVPAVGLRMPGMRPLALQSGSQFRPDGPNPLTSPNTRRTSSRSRTSAPATAPRGPRSRPAWRCSGPTTTSGSGTTACCGLAAARGLGLVQAARMLALAHVAGGDAMIGCFDAKYHYWFWRPHQAIARADTDGKPVYRGRAELAAAAPDAELPRVPVRRTPATRTATPRRSRRSSAPTASRSRSTAGSPARPGSTTASTRSSTTSTGARVLAGFHFRNSDQEGSTLGPQGRPLRR